MLIDTNVTNTIIQRSKEDERLLFILAWRVSMATGGGDNVRGRFLRYQRVLVVDIEKKTFLK